MITAIKRISPGPFFISILIFSIVIFVAHTKVTKNAIFADGRFYFAYTRSWVIDRDMNLVNDFELLGIKPSLNWRGLAINTFSPGSAILWFFPYLNIDNFLKLVLPQRVGLEYIYQFTVGFMNIFLGIMGLYLLYLVLRKYFGNNISLFSILTLFTTTNLLFYIAVEPINSHANSFFISALIIYYLFVKIKKISFKDAFILGILSGFAGAIRTQDILIVLVPAIFIFWKIEKKLKMQVMYSILLIAGLFIGFLPQIYLWKLFFNFFLPYPGWGYGFSFANPHIIHVLFNSQNGLLTLTPSIITALIGLFLFRKNQRWISFVGIFYFLIQLYLISSWRDYTQGGSFSIRMLITTYPFLSFGYGFIQKKFNQRIGFNYTIALIAIFFLINSLLITRYLLLY